MRWGIGRIAASLALGGLLLAALPGTGSSAGATGSPWLAYGRTPTADNIAATSVTPAQAKAFHQVWKSNVAGTVYAQPLEVPSVKVDGKAHDLVIVATAANDVYALDAGTGRTLWRRSLGPTVPNVCQSAGGIESTPAVDEAAGLVFVIAADGRLHALALATGKPDLAWSVQIIKRTDVETAWSALRIANGLIYVPVASWCDTNDKAGAWDGRLDAVSLTTRRIAHTFDVVPGPDNGGGIWGPGGVSIDPGDNSIWTATANAAVYHDGTVAEKTPDAERVIHLTPSLKVLSSVVQPDNNDTLLGDQGFGSTPMLFQPAGCPPLVAVNSKDLYTYAWNRDDLAAAPVLRELFGQPGSSNTFFAEPTWDAGTLTLVVDGATLPNGNGTKGVVGLRLEGNCTFNEAWETNIGGGIEPQPLVAGSVVFAPATGAGQLIAIDTDTGDVLAELSTDGPAYTAPMLADGRVVVATPTGAVLAFGAS